MKNAESALKRRIDYQIINEYRVGHQRPQQWRAVHVHEVGLDARQERPGLREGDGEGPVRASADGSDSQVVAMAQGTTLGGGLGVRPADRAGEFADKSRVIRAA